MTRPVILDAISLDRHAVIEASAGTGKTFALEQLVVEILLSTDTDLESILIVTFTERAAGELRARLRAKLRATLDSEPGAEAKAKLIRALTRFDLASISTIHAFCQGVLLDHAFSAGRLFEQELVDGKALFSRAFLTALRTRIALEGPSQAYLDAWLCRNTLEAIEDLLFQCHEKRGVFRPRYVPDRVLTGLRNISAIGVDPDRMRRVMSDARIHRATVDAFLSRYARLLDLTATLRSESDLPRFLALLADEDQGSNGFLEYLAKKAADLSLPDPAAVRVLEAIEQLAEELPSLASAVAQTLLPHIRQVLEHDKVKTGRLDFDDMLDMLWASLESEHGGPIAEALRTRFRYALVDEFQDTDHVQWRIFRRLFLEGGLDSVAPRANALFVIGDPKQAIYGFRGADVHTYLEAVQEIAASGGAKVPLIENYRSDARLVEALNAILDQSAEDPFFSGAIRYDLPVRPSIDRRSSVPAVHIFELSEENGAGSGAAKGRGSMSASKNALGRKIALEIRALLDGALGPSRDPGQIFVLTRTGPESVEMGRHLRALRIPHAFYKQEGLFQTPEAEHIRDLLLAIADPHKSAARLRAWLSPFFSVPLESLSASLDLGATHPNVSRLFDWKALADAKDYSRLFNRIIEGSGIIKRELFLEGSERALTNYLHIFELLLEEANRARSTLEDLIRTLSAFIDGRRLPEGENGNVQRLESERSAVQIMTMHKAKGLEAEVVFLFGGFGPPGQEVQIYHQDGERVIGLGRGSRNPLAERERREEDERLLYVAITRAKDRLYLPYLPNLPGGRDRIGAGAYRALNTALARIAQDIDRNPFSTLFSKEVVPIDEPAPSLPGPRITELLANWDPPSALFEEPGSRGEIDRLRGQHLGFTITSYSRIKALSGGYHRPSREEAPEPPRSSAVPRSPVFPPAAIAHRGRDGEAPPVGHALPPGQHAMPKSAPGVAEDTRDALEPATLPPVPRAMPKSGPGVAEDTRDTLEPATLPPGPRAMPKSAPGVAEDTRDALEPEIDSFSEDRPGLDLPGGPASGRFIHQALERVDLEQVRDAPSFAFWAARRDIKELFLALLKRHDRDPAHLLASQELVFSALTTTLRLGATTLSGGIAHAARTVREMEFLYPIPDRWAPRLEPLERAQPAIERGFIKGFIDLVFEHDEKSYILDWKSDLLPSYGEDELFVHARQNYALQGDLYTVALMKLLGLASRQEYERRFGGVVFCFVRGMQRAARPIDGVLFLRPTWNEVIDGRSTVFD